MTKGYYSLIQYCPDFSRAEAANVGLVLFQPEPTEAAVRVLEDIKPALRRLGSAGPGAAVLRDVRAMNYRLQQERFRSVEDFEQFVRTRGNKLQLTAPRPMRIEVISKDLNRMFAELVEPVQSFTPAAAAGAEEKPLLRRTFEDLSRRLPDRAWVDHEFHHKELGIAIRSDYAYKNGSLNLVQEMPRAHDVDAVRLNAFGMSREGELVRQLEEGEGTLYVVSTAATRKARDLEQAFGETLRKVGKATFIPSDEAEEFVQRVERELAEHE